MVDTTLIYEMKTEINPESSPEPESNPVKKRGRPKKIKTPEEIEHDKQKHREYYRNYYKERSAKDPEFAEKYRSQLLVRTKRYYNNHKEEFKSKYEDMVRKSKLYDELVKNLSV
jgi:hypothetical protein